MGTVLAKPDNTPEPSQAEVALAHLREELELIAYIASHDLLAPVRIINHSYDILKEKRAASGDVEEQDALKTLDSEILRIRALLQGLLEYIRLETFVLKHTPVDANELVDTAIETMAQEVQAANASVTRDPLPTVIGHRGRLTRLFAQLIENAIKFRSEQPPRIHISAKRNGNECTFCVEDNGIGIDPELQEVVFRLFQRLHTAEAYPGYGIGLALSQKIIASHGGRLWVESELGKGSRFFFTLPASET